jgi:hypothetical protein
MRRAQNMKPATYRCPFCDQYLPALSEHVLLMPEGDPSRRRHAHTDCVLAERKAGRLPTQDEWRRAQPASVSDEPGRRSGMATWLWRRIPWKIVWALALWLVRKGQERVDENLTDEDRHELVSLVTKSRGRPSNLAQRDRTRIKNIVSTAIRG